MLTDKNSEDKGYLAFMQMRVDLFDELWTAFKEGGDLSDETVKQVINGIPIEALLDWKRRQEFLAANDSSKRYYASRIEFVKDTECLHWFVGGEPKTEKWGPVTTIGNINGHVGGVQVTEKANGKLHFHMVNRTTFSESWDDVDPASVKITREETP